EHIPAKDAVDAGGLLGEPLHQERGQLIEQTVPHMTIDVLRQILDDDLATKLLAEKTDVGTNHGTEIEEYRLRAGTQAGNETRKHLGRVHRCIRGTDLRL